MRHEKRSHHAGKEQADGKHYSGGNGKECEPNNRSNSNDRRDQEGKKRLNDVITHRVNISSDSAKQVAALDCCDAVDWTICERVVDAQT